MARIPSKRKIPKPEWLLTQNHQQNKDIILNYIENHRPIFKTHVQHAIAGAWYGRWHAPSRESHKLYNDAWSSLLSEGKIIYTPYKPVKLNTDPRCPCGSFELKDITGGFGDKRHWNCLKCDRFYWDVWWSGKTWRSLIRKDSTVLPLSDKLESQL